MKKLLDGVARFEESEAPSLRPLLAHLATHGQEPHAMMITCADSRVMPLEVTQSEPGDLFVVRNIGNLVPDGEMDASVGAAVEFAIGNLKIDNLIVMGHSRCGAMQALLSDEPPTGQLKSWLRHGVPSVEMFRRGALARSSWDDGDRLSQVNVLHSLQRLAKYRIVEESVASGQLSLHGWWYDVATATTLAYDERRDAFLPLEEVYDVKEPRAEG